MPSRLPSILRRPSPLAHAARPVACALALAGAAALAAPLDHARLTEFVAANGGGLTDADGDASDWIEVWNPGAEAGDLGGWFLTDDPDNLTKWEVPGVELEAGGYLVVFASGKNLRDPAGELHCNFRIGRDAGGYLALVRPDGVTVASAFAGYPEQRAGVSYGTGTATPVPDGGFYPEPTPGAENGERFDGLVADTKFSVDRGFFGIPFELAITTATEDAEVRFTTDGSEPTASSGEVYTGPVTITETTVVRAMAHRPGWRPTNVDTHTYVFPGLVASQPRLPDGFPSRWGSVTADYEMDPDITGRWPDEVRSALHAFPSIAVSTHVDNLFDRTSGIYSRSDQHGVNWERPASVEWIHTDGTTGFQVDCGLRIQGGYFRGPNTTQKHSFRFLFKDEYGPGKLRFKLFDAPTATDEFDTVVLRAGANDGYSWSTAAGTEQFIRDEFGRRMQLAMGHPAAHGRFVHLYLNGLYWGVYNLTERPNEDFSSTYLGGAPEDWDANNAGDPKNGSTRNWVLMTRDMRNPDLERYMKVQGLDPDGGRNPGYDVFFDKENYIDYFILNSWGGNWDWPNKNFWFGRYNGPGSTGFKFYIWDYEDTMLSPRSPLTMVSPRSGPHDEWVGIPHEYLKRFQEYQLDFADRVQRLFFDGGLLTPEVVAPVYQALADHIEPAIYAESARWGDDHHRTPQDITDWRRMRDRLLTTYFPRRTEIVLSQYERAGLYPSTDAPSISPRGGGLPPGTPVSLTAAAGEVFYTTDGSDPRLPGGEANPAATLATAGAPLTLTAPTLVRARARSEDGWSALQEASFTIGTVPAAASNLVVAEVHYRPAEPTSAGETAISTDRDDYEFVEVLNTGPEPVDLTGVRFSTGIQFAFPDRTTLQAGGRAVIVKHGPAFRARYGEAVEITGSYDGRLSNEGETLTLTGPSGEIWSTTYNDASPWPTIPDGGGPSLVLADAGSHPDPDVATNWAAHSDPGGNPGGADTVAVDPAGTFAEWKAALGLTGAADDSDDDGDGLNLFGEYATGRSPFVASEPPVAEIATRSAGATRILELRVAVNPDAGDVAVIPEISSALGTWTAGTGAVQLVRTEPGAGGGTATSVYEIEVPAGTVAPTFVRVRFESL